MEDISHKQNIYVFLHARGVIHCRKPACCQLPAKQPSIMTAFHSSQRFLCLHLVYVGVGVYGYVCRMHCYNKWGRRGVSVGGRRRRWWLNECICLAVMAWEQIDACSGCKVTCLFPPQPATKIHKGGAGPNIGKVHQRTTKILLWKQTKRRWSWWNILKMNTQFQAFSPATCTFALEHMAPDISIYEDREEEYLVGLHHAMTST